ALEVDRAVDEDRVVVVRAVDAVPAGAANGSSAADSPGPPSGSPVRRPWRHLPARPRFLPGWPSPPGLDLGLGGPARRPGDQALQLLRVCGPGQRLVQAHRAAPD